MLARWYFPAGISGGCSGLIVVAIVSTESAVTINTPSSDVSFTALFSIFKTADLETAGKDVGCAYKEQNIPPIMLSKIRIATGL